MSGKKKVKTNTFIICVPFWCGGRRGGCQSRERGREIKSSSDVETLRNDGKVLGKILLLL